jgi:hypothetical protein
LLLLCALSVSAASLAQPEAPSPAEGKPAESKPAEPKPEPSKDNPIKAEPERAHGASAQNAALANEITPELTAAVTKGVEYLVKQQGPDGAFGDGRFGRNVAVTSLASIAVMADGNLPGRGPHGDAISRAVDYVLQNATESGLIASDSSSGPMYGHGFATLFLGEVYGMTAGGGDNAQSHKLHEALVKAVHLIEQTQNEQGGWRYNPVPYDADVSVTICQIMALRSARNAGIEVAKDTVDRAVDYVRRCQNADGGFRYQLDLGPSAWPRSAAGVATFFYAGIYEDKAIDSGLEYIAREATPGVTNPGRAHYWYGHYYSVQAMYLAGGPAWARWWPAVRDELLRAQQDDGHWEDRAVGDVYGTSMALIVLQMPKRYLPIFQK